MTASREKWTDERLDDLNQKVDSGFERVDRELVLLRTEMNSRFDSLQRSMLQVTVVLSGTMITGFAATIALAVT